MTALQRTSISTGPKHHRRSEPSGQRLQIIFCSFCSMGLEMHVPEGITMPNTTPELNKALLLEAFDTLFNKRDYKAAERFWSPNYIQHSAHIAPGRNGLFDLIKATPPTLRYEHALVVVDGDLVVLHGRFSGLGLPVNWIAVDIVRVQDGLLAEHWDVIQDEATREQSKSGHPMFGTLFPD